MRDLSTYSHLLQQQIGVEQIDHSLFCVAAVQKLQRLGSTPNCLFIAMLRLL